MSRTVPTDEIAQEGRRLVGKILEGESFEPALAKSADLEKMKVLCKQIWPLIFGNAIDELRTNHKVQEGFYFQ